jgi:hypothetical protein
LKPKSSKKKHGWPNYSLITFRKMGLSWPISRTDQFIYRTVVSANHNSTKVSTWIESKNTKVSWRMRRISINKTYVICKRRSYKSNKICNWLKIQKYKGSNQKRNNLLLLVLNESLKQKNRWKDIWIRFKPTNLCHHQENQFAKRKEVTINLAFKNLSNKTAKLNKL